MAGTVFGFYLGPAGEAGFYNVAGFVERHHCGKFFNKNRTLWSRANDTHLASQNIIELRKLIDPGATQEFAKTRDAGIILLGPLRSVRLGITLHGAELYDPERFGVLPYPLLGIEQSAPVPNKISQPHKGDKMHANKN